MSESDIHDDCPASHLQVADEAFAALTVGPAPLALNCVELTAASIAASGTAASGTAAGTAVSATAMSGSPASGTAEPGIPAPGIPASGTAEGGTTAGPGAVGSPAAGGADTVAGGAGMPAVSDDVDHPPAGEVPLPALRDWLLEHPSAYAVRDAVWRELIHRARLGKPEWVIAAVGMAMPALVSMAGALAAGYRGDPADIDGEILTGFLEELRAKVDPAADAPYASLLFAAWRAGWDLRLAQQEDLPVPDIEHAAAESRLPRAPYGHVDLLIYRAAALGLIDAEDVDPYIDIRLGARSGITPELVADQAGIDYDTLRMRLNRADTRLTWALAEGILTGTASPEARGQLAQRQRQRDATRAGKAAARREGRYVRTSPAAAAA